MGFQELCPGRHMFPVIYRSQKYDISDNAYKIFHFTVVEGRIYRSETAINQLLTARKKMGRGKYVF
jgi:hypothetical protein